MAESVDSVVLQLEAKLGSYNADVANAANASEKSLQRIGTAASATEKSLGTMANNSRISQQILQHVVRSTTDSFAAGTPPMMIFTTHIGQLVEAAEFAGGSLGKVGTFLSGPWGIAATIAATTLLPLIGNLLKTSDGVDDLIGKLKDHLRQSEASERANKLFAQSLEGVEQAARDQEKALAALENRNKTQEQQTVESIKGSLDRAKAIRIETQALLDAAKASNERYNGSLASADPRFAREFQVPQSRIDELQKQLEKSNKEATDAEARLTRAVSLRTVEQASRDPAKVINDRYDAQVEGARKAAVASGKVTTALDLEVKAINKARDAELKRLKDTDSARKQHGNNAETGRELSFAEARSIAEGAHLRVTSDYRSTAHQAQLYNDPSVNKPGNPVARPGTSAHEGANGRWALDIQLGPGVTPELLRKVFAAQGVTLSKVFKEQGHYHIEGQRSQTEVQADKEAEQAQKAAEQEAKRYDTTKARLQLENELQHLRSTGDLEDARRADILESDYQIESQFPDLAKSTEKADRDRLQVLKDIADAAINEEYGRKQAEAEAKRQKSLQDQMVKLGEEEQQAVQKGMDEQMRHQEEQIRTLAGLYLDAFTGGTHAIWDDFKRVGLEVVAEVLAKFTLAKIAGGGFDLGSAISGALSHGLPGFAGGGSIMIGGRGGVDQNVLSLNGTPMARVSAGEVLNIGNDRLGPGGGATVIQNITVDARNSVNPEGFARQILSISGQQAQQASATMGQRVVKAIPGRMATFQRDGF